MSATRNWNVTDAEFPEYGTPRQKLGFAVKYAMLAPPERNWQPWQCRVSDHCLELFSADGSPAGSFDPEGREALISCGAALQYLKLTLKRFGCLGRVELFPDLDQPSLVASIHFGSGRELNPQDQQLFAALTTPRMNSLPLNEAPIPDALLDVLSRSVTGDRGWLEFARSEVSQRRLLDLTATSERPQASEVQLRRESAGRSAVRNAGWESGGFANAALRGRFARWTRPLLTFKVRATPETSQNARGGTEFRVRTGTLAVLKTKTDDKHGWVAAGQMLARLILHAQSLGLSWSLLDRALRKPDVRAALRTGIGHKGYAQAILGFGAAIETSVPPNVMRPATATGTFR